MFDAIAEHESRKTELPNAICLTKLRIFLLFPFNLFQFKDLINKC